MEVYIEAIYLIHVILILISLQMTNILLNVKETMKETIKHTIFLSSTIIVLYVDFRFLLYCMWFLLFLWLYRRQFFLFYPVFLLMYFSISYFICSLIKEAFLFQGILILPSVYLSISWVPIILIFVILEIVFVVYCRRKIQMDQYMLDVVLYHLGEKIVCKGFLDTGNEVYYDGFPLLLVNRRLLKQYQVIDQVTVNNVKNLILDVIVIDKVELNQQVLKNVYVGLLDNIKYDCLLNKQLMGGIL